MSTGEHTETCTVLERRGVACMMCMLADAETDYELAQCVEAAANEFDEGHACERWAISTLKAARDGLPLEVEA